MLASLIYFSGAAFPVLRMRRFAVMPSADIAMRVGAEYKFSLTFPTNFQVISFPSYECPVAQAPELVPQNTTVIATPDAVGDSVEVVTTPSYSCGSGENTYFTSKSSLPPSFLTILGAAIASSLLLTSVAIAFQISQVSRLFYALCDSITHHRTRKSRLCASNS